MQIIWKKRMYSNKLYQLKNYIDNINEISFKSGDNYE